MFSIGSLVAASAGSSSGKVDLTIEGWHWPVLLGVIGAMLLIDILVVHKNAHEIHTKEAAIESAVWISVGLLFGLVMLWEFGSAAAGEYMGGYLIERASALTTCLCGLFCLRTSRCQRCINTEFSSGEFWRPCYAHRVHFCRRCHH